MTREQAINYLKSSGMTKEQIETVVDAFTCEDCISRQDVMAIIEWAYDECKIDGYTDYCEMRDMVKGLPSVTPKAETITEFADRCRECGAKYGKLLEQKIGHWLAKSFHEVYCDNCGFDFDIMRNEFIDKMNYCPNCGAKMHGSNESSNFDSPMAKGENDNES